MTEPLSANIRNIVGAGLFLIGVGIWWAEWTNRLAQKADKAEVEAVARDLEAHLKESAEEWRVKRILLCRIPEIRPDSHCEGYR